uniref:Ig-like domain-containing protein n=1 Tax=Sinocyclocheilus anshuiensis TaxID=1608454 RepID=A0A671MZN1_9TELE
MLLSPGVYSIELIQPDSKELKPGQPLSLSCKVSGYSLSSCGYCTNWIRQASGGLEWIRRVCCNGDTHIVKNVSGYLCNHGSLSRERDTASSRGRYGEHSGLSCVFLCKRITVCGNDRKTARV